MIDLDKILTVSANTFYESKGLNKKDYELVGVYTFGIMEPSASNNKVSPKSKFAQKVPEDAIAVTDYRVAISTYGYFTGYPNVFYEANGTALIPKK